MQLYKKTILFVTFIFLITLGWGGICKDGDEDCGACCYYNTLIDMDMCNQTDNSHNEWCGTKPAMGYYVGVDLKTLNGCVCPSTCQGAWCSENLLSCGCLTENACCVEGYFQGLPSAMYSCFEKPESTPECCGNACGDCNSSEDDSDCNDDGIPDDCEEIYNEGIVEAYTSGLEEGILIGGQSGDANGDGTLDILDIVYFIDVILNP